MKLLFVIFFIELFGTPVNLYSQNGKESTSSQNVIDYAKFSHTHIGQIRAGGWLQQMVESEKNGVTSHLDEISNLVGSHIFFNHDVSQDGQLAWWNGEYESNWIDGLTNLACSTDDSVLQKKVKKWFDELLEIQDHDKESYIGIYSIDAKKFPRWSNLCGELWPQSRVFLAMLSLYDHTHDARILVSLKKAAVQTIAHLQRDLPEYKNHVNSHALMMVEPMAKLYLLTHEKRFLYFSVFLYDKLRWFNDKTLQGELFLHGVHVVQNIRIPLILFECTGDPKYLIEGKKGIDLCINRYMNVAGTVRSDEMIGYAAPDRGSEYCTTVEWLITNIRAAVITGDMRYADIAERCYFNAAQGARLPNGKAIQYLTFPNQLYAIEQGVDEWKNQPLFGPAHNPLCCNSMAGRILPSFLNNTWVNSKDGGFMALLYGPCIFKTVLKSDNKISISEITNYPFEDHIQFLINVDYPEAFPLHFRIPAWCDSFSLKINNQTVQVLNQNAIVTLKFLWKKGDVIDLYLPMKAKPDFLREWASVVRGPLVYVLPVMYEQVETEKIITGFSFFRFVPKKDFKWNQFLMFNHFPKDSMFVTHQTTLLPGESPWEHPPVSISTMAQVSNDKWRLGMQWYTGESLQPPVPPSAILDYQIDQSLSKEINLVPYGTTRLRITYFPYAVKVIE